MYTCHKHHEFHNKKENNSKIYVNYSFGTLKATVLISIIIKKIQTVRSGGSQLSTLPK
jgi:hypothetical protein